MLQEYQAHIEFTELETNLFPEENRECLNGSRRGAQVHNLGGTFDEIT